MRALPLARPAGEAPSAEDRAHLVAAHGLVVRAGGQTLLDGVDIHVDPDELVTLIGPNGAGKTTLVRALLGIVRPAAGRVWRREGLRVGYLPQRLHIDPTLPLTVLRLLALTRPARRAAIDEALDEVGAAHLAARALQGLSGGELQRVLLARALVREPQLLILDEPVQGVDVTGQAELYDLIAGIRERRGCGVLLISHDLHLVLSTTDRVVCLNRHICCAGHPEHVVRDPAYLGLFGGRAAASLAVYTHDHGHPHRHESAPPARDARS